MSLGPNDLLPHGTPGRVKSHRAHGVICPVCMPDEERLTVCPLCRHLRTAVGDRMAEHTVGGRGWGFATDRCAGSGMQVAVEPVEDGPLLRLGRRAAA
jgi:hypothetical protein